MRLALGLFLVGAGLVAWQVAESVGGGSAKVGPNRPVDPTATDPLDQSADNSPVVRVNPKDPANLAVASRIDRPAWSCGLHVSFDGGATWGMTPIPRPEGRSVSCFSPDLAFGADGSLYMAFTSLGQETPQGTSAGPDALWLARSNDGGRAFSSLVKAAGASVFEVRLASDPNRPERLYLAWLQGGQIAGFGFAGDGNPIVVSRSDDYGSSWAEPGPVNPPSRRRVVAPSVVIEQSGRLLVGYLDVGDDRLDYHGEHAGREGLPYNGRWTLLLARSDDGRTWSESTIDDGVVPTGRFLVLHPPSPSVALDPGRGRVYVGFHDGRLGDPDVVVWASGDGGVTWSGSRRVNDTPPRDRRSQHLPKLAAAPDGRLDVVYYDRRDDAQDIMTGVSFQSSFDGGRTFREHVAVARRSFDSGIGGSAGGLPALGDRLGLVVTDAGALAMWTDTRGGTRESGKQDLASALIAVTPPSSLRKPLGFAGLATALAGAVLAAWALRPLADRPRRKGRRDPSLQQ